MFFEKIAKLIADYKEMDVQEIREETLLQEDLELDSLDTVELMMSIEQEFDATIELNGEVKTVGDVVALVREQVNHAE
jgi:acyl carrier protein